MKAAVERYLKTRNLKMLERSLFYVDPTQRSEIKSHMIVYQLENDEKLDRLRDMFVMNKNKIIYNGIATICSPICMPIEFMSHHLFSYVSPYPLGIIFPVIFSYNVARFVQRAAVIGYADIKSDDLVAVNREIDKLMMKL